MGRNGSSSNRHHDQYVDKEAERVRKVCEEQGLMLNWNEATAIVARNSEIGRRMSIREAERFIIDLRNGRWSRRLLG